MCGISFYWDAKNIVDKSQLVSSLNFTEHRGPNAKGDFYAESQGGSVGLGHNRLSVIDLSESANQPFYSKNKDVVIVFNGEIYNFNEIKSELASKGVVFHTCGDTEVILNAYIYHGVSAFKMFKGMFSFCIYDARKNLMFVVRDFIGIKPVYLYQEAGVLIGCSEIKGLRAYPCVDLTVSHDDAYEFFNHGFINEPRTGFTKIQKLRPGHYLELDTVSGEVKNFAYAELADYAENTALEEKISTAVDQQLVSDVPLGVFFSGGLDSSILASKTSDASLLFAQYDSQDQGESGMVDDAFYADEVAKHLARNLDVASMKGGNDELESIRFVAEHTEELVSDYTFWATYLLAKKARESGYTVMLSGMGGDEVFAGYPRYLVLRYKLLFSVVNKAITLLSFFGLKFDRLMPKKMSRFLAFHQEQQFSIAYARLTGYFSKSELEEVFKLSSSTESDFLNRMVQVEVDAGCSDNMSPLKKAQRLDLKGFLAHNLTVSDKASMLASIELRVPLLAESVVAHGIAENEKKLIRGSSLKHPLKKILAKILPGNLVNRPKTGFNPPLDGVVMRMGREGVLSILDSNIRVYDFLQRAGVEKVLDRHFSNVENNTYKIWQIVYFKFWLDWAEQKS